MTVEPPGSSSSSSKSSSTDYSVHYGTGGQVDAKPIKWLGMEFTGKEAQQLWDTIINAMTQQISQDQKKAVEAIQLMNPDNNPDNQ